MTRVTSYVRKSRTGFYAYRRRVPNDCRDAFGKLEEKRSLKTKSHCEALSRGAVVNEEFERQVASIRRENGIHGHDTEPPDTLGVHYATQGAGELLHRHGIHPSQRPDFQADPAEVRAYGDTLTEFFNQYEDMRYEGTDPTTGTPTYAPMVTTSQWDQAARIVRGEQPATIEPTLKQCLELYLEINQEQRQRSEHNKKKFDQAHWRAVERLASFL
ncbi:MAG: hypothetical protein NXH74_13565, partial [Rhodobacteraceae bacterium]|nr:hypothetical protein [Paracoccaceae bacterium]